MACVICWRERPVDELGVCATCPGPRGGQPQKKPRLPAIRRKQKRASLKRRAEAVARVVLVALLFASPAAAQPLEWAVVTDRDLVVGLEPLAVDLIFADGFESGDTSAWRREGDPSCERPVGRARVSLSCVSGATACSAQVSVQASWGGGVRDPLWLTVKPKGTPAPVDGETRIYLHWAAEPCAGLGLALLASDGRFLESVRLDERCRARTIRPYAGPKRIEALWPSERSWDVELPSTGAAALHFGVASMKEAP